MPEEHATVMANRLTKIFNELHDRYPGCLTIEGGMSAAARERDGYIRALMGIIETSKENFTVIRAIAALKEYHPYE